MERKINEICDLRVRGQLTPFPLSLVNTELHKGPNRRTATAERGQRLAALDSRFVYHDELVNKDHELFIYINPDRLLFMKSI